MKNLLTKFFLVSIFLSTSFCWAADADTDNLVTSIEQYDKLIKLQYDELVKQPNTPESLARVLLITGALNGKGVILFSKGELDKALTCFDDAIQLIKSQELSNKEYLPREVYQAIVADIQKELSILLTHKGFMLLNIAKKNWNNENQRNHLLNNSLNLFVESKTTTTSKHEDNILRALNNLVSSLVVEANIAYAHWLLGNKNEATEHLKTAFSLKVDDVHNGVLEDTERFNIPIVDDEFKSLINKIWQEAR